MFHTITQKKIRTVRLKTLHDGNFYSFTVLETFLFRDKQLIFIFFWGQILYFKGPEFRKKDNCNSSCSGKDKIIHHENMDFAF